MTLPACDNRAARFLFVMDAYEDLDRSTETSLLLMQELIERGHCVFWMQQEGLALEHDRPVGRVSRVIDVEPLVRAQPVWSPLDRFDAVLVRKDPPFDTEYLQLTLILDHLDPGVVQFNEARALRDFNEKMLPLRWPQFTPPSLVTMSADRLARFARRHRTLVLKPLNDCSGRGIEKLEWDARGNHRRQIEAALRGPDGKPRFVLAQLYLDAVIEGDKRVYLVDGQPLGMVNRIPQPGSFLANIHQGATSVATQLSAREDEIIRTIAPFLREQGILLAGADFIGGYLTELNITSPSAVRQINEVSGGHLHIGIVDAMLQRTKRRSCRSGCRSTSPPPLPQQGPTRASSAC